MLWRMTMRTVAMRRLAWGLVAALPAMMAAQPGMAAAKDAKAAGSSLRFEVKIADSVQKGEPLTGHLILVISKDEKQEPRFQLKGTYDSAQGFGVDVEGLKPGAAIVVDDATVGFPLLHLGELPAGDYTVQAVFNKYEEFHLATGKTVWLPPEKGEGQHWQIKPGNPLNAPVKIHLDGKSGATVKLTLDKVIPPVEEEAVDVARVDDWADFTHPMVGPDNKWLKHVTIRSEKLSKFWGRDVYIKCMVLLPDGWDEHPDAHYPVIVWEDHFHPDFFTVVAFRQTPPTPDMKDYEKTYAEYSYKFFQDWTAGRLPRVIILQMDHANPYYDDSYAVNSANLGPYGDAITEEVIPQIEKQFRGIGQGWARATYGGSTGGWESLAQQVFYPDFYNGVWTNCPDPVDFRAYQTVNLYEDSNAYFRSGMFGEIPIAAERTVDGNIIAEVEGSNRYEYVLGTKGRSGEQWDIWQAVFSPAGEDGYPKAIYDKRTGVIDKDVAKYWHDNYDLDAKMVREWPELGPKLEGKVHVAVGESDTYFLNNAVHLMQEEMDATRNPHSDATFDYGPRQPHCYSGDPSQSTRITRLTINQRVLPEMVKHMLATAPAGSDVTSWRY
jgi:hypothetical protein